MKFGDKLYLVLTDAIGTHRYYTEPFIFDKNFALQNFNEAIRIFSENSYDAVDTLVKDAKENERLADLPDYPLIVALRERGYTVTKC